MVLLKFCEKFIFRNIYLSSLNIIGSYFLQFQPKVFKYSSRSSLRNFDFGFSFWRTFAGFHLWNFSRITCCVRFKNPPEVYSTNSSGFPQKLLLLKTMGSGEFFWTFFRVSFWIFSSSLDVWSLEDVPSPGVMPVKYPENPS